MLINICAFPHIPDCFKRVLGMRRKPAEELRKCLVEIEKLVESSRTQKEAIKLKKQKIKALGGVVKKQPILLKRMIAMSKKKNGSRTERMYKTY